MVMAEARANGSGDEEENRLEGRIPERVELAGHDQIETAEGRLMEGGKNHARDYRGIMMVCIQASWRFQPRRSIHHREGIQEKHGGYRAITHQAISK